MLIEAYKNKDDVIIKVIDQGIGVDNKHLSHIFDAFYRVSEARERDIGGTGLGLAIAKHAVVTHHGKISAENNDSGGLTITLELPINQ